MHAAQISDIAVKHAADSQDRYVGYDADMRGRWYAFELLPEPVHLFIIEFAIVAGH